MSFKVQVYESSVLPQTCIKWITWAFFIWVIFYWITPDISSTLQKVECPRYITMANYWAEEVVQHSVEITKFCSYMIFLRKFREINCSTNESTCKLISRKNFKVGEKFSFFHTMCVQKFLKIGHSVETSWISPIVLLQQDQCLQLDAICLKLAVLLLTVIVLCNERHKHERKQKLKCCNESFWTKFRQIDLVWT